MIHNTQVTINSSVFRAHSASHASRRGPSDALSRSRRDVTNNRFRCHSVYSSETRSDGRAELVVRREGNDSAELAALLALQQTLYAINDLLV